MRQVCPRDVEKTLVQIARSVYWKKWAAKCEHEELKEEHGLSQPSLSCERSEGGVDRQAAQCGQKTIPGMRMGAKETLRYRLVGCQACREEEGTEMFRLYREIPDVFRKSESKKQKPQLRCGSGKEASLRIH